MRLASRTIAPVRYEFKLLAARNSLLDGGGLGGKTHYLRAFSEVEVGKPRNRFEVVELRFEGSPLPPPDHGLWFHTFDGAIRHHGKEVVYEIDQPQDITVPSAAALESRPGRPLREGLTTELDCLSRSRHALKTSDGTVSSITHTVFACETARELRKNSDSVCSNVCRPSRKIRSNGFSGTVLQKPFIRWHLEELRGVILVLLPVEPELGVHGDLVRSRHQKRSAMRHADFRGAGHVEAG